MIREEKYDFSTTSLKANLYIEIPNYYNLPLTIRKSDFQLLGYSRSDRNITLDPSLYIVQVTDPLGNTKNRIVDLTHKNYERIKL